MPWTPAQVRLFYAAASGKVRKKGLSRKKARSLLAHDKRGTKKG